jgi:hypothetical protein
MISFHNLGSYLDRGVRNFVTKTFVPNMLEAWDHLEQLAYAFLIPISGQSKRWMKYMDFAIASSCKELAANAAPEI